ncbi:esterase-like activity of phytase family protein [Lyngbya confervoides]|uniref:Esterase-like activity of phytase family protein n=1 Tax=Lyngbya confervoides BDU141951 TaxID=1574623 RepID=A0ABD4SY66_9CYAN|nr:esterase-like activity of phytase family protein [Lyngbya confervoides]MCM1981426.1 esterase-like activity of phytase family protein [Lyngbya confervoides BDU141951]
MNRLALKTLIPVLTLICLWGCTFPEISAEARTFLNLSIEYLDRYELLQTTVEDTTLGGISAIAYDRQTQTYLALADAKENPRIYRLAIPLESTQPPQFGPIAVQKVIRLQAPQTQDGRSITLDPEGLALGSNQWVYVASEGSGSDHPALFAAFDANSGNLKTTLPTPQRFQAIEQDQQAVSGIYPNLGFESLTLTPEGDRLFSATEAPLVQDAPPDPSQPSLGVRLLHYWIGVGDPYVVAEHLYPLELPPLGSLFNGLSELLAIDSGGHFLSLERAVNPVNHSFSAQLFQSAVAMASDIRTLEALPEKLGNLIPIQKRLLFNFSTLDFPLGNLEGMTFGPLLADGSRSLILVSDNGFDPKLPSEFLLFRVRQLPAMTAHP